MAAPNFQSMVVASFLALLHAQKLIGFESFIELHGRSYKQGSSEFEMRKSLYEQRKTASESHNNNPNRLWTAGVNKLWDWTAAELQTLRGWDGGMMPEGHLASTRSVRKHGVFLQQEDDLPKE